MKAITVLMCILLLVMIIIDTMPKDTAQKMPLKIHVGPSGIVSIYIDGFEPIFF